MSLWDFQSRLTIAVFFGMIFFNLADGLMFHLEPNSRKCLKEEIHKGVLVTGDYDAHQIPNQVVDLMVIDTKGQHFVNRENTDTGKDTTVASSILEVWSRRLEVGK